NNTSACSAGGTPSYCASAFSPMSDAVSGTYNPVPQNVSKEKMGELLYSGNDTMWIAHYQPWFNTASTSHVQTGYNSNDVNTVNGQMNDMISRGFTAVISDWYGQGQTTEDQTTQKIRDNLNGR